MEDQKPENKPSKISKKYLSIIFISTMWMSLGAYYNFNFPQIYEDIMIKKFNITPVEVELLYSVYSFPNFLITPLGSLMLTYTGLGFGIVLFNFFVFFGPTIVLLGFYSSKFWLVVLGRIVYGFGSEVSTIAQAAISERWFSGKGLSISQGINRTFGFLGATSALFFGPQFFIQTRSMDLTLTAYSLSGAFSFFSSAAYCFFEIFYERENKKKGELDEEENKRKNRKFKISQIKKMGKLFWMVAIIFSLGSQTYLQFMGFATDCLVSRFGFTFEEAKNKLSLLPIICMILLPPLSFFIVWFGRKGYILLVSFFFGAGSILYLRTLPPNPGNIIYVIIFCLAFHYSLFASVIWSSMMLCVPPVAAAASMGISITFQNIFLTGLPIVFGILNKKRTVEEYDTSLLYVSLISVVSGILTVFMIVIDVRTGGKLNLPENDKRVGEMREEMAVEFEGGEDVGEYKSIGVTRSSGRTKDLNLDDDEGFG